MPVRAGATETASATAAEASGAEGLPGRQETAAVTAAAPEGEILFENVEHLSRDDREGEDRGGAVRGTGLVAGDGAEDGQPTR